MYERLKVTKRDYSKNLGEMNHGLGYTIAQKNGFDSTCIRT